MNWSTLLQRVEDESADTKVRLSILEKLKSYDEPEVVEVLVRSCFSWNGEIAQHCHTQLKQLPLDKLQPFFQSLFTNKFGATGNKYFLLMEELRSLDMMKYILGMVGSGKTEAMHYQQIRLWLQQSGIIHKYLKAVLSFPPAVAKNVFMLLTQIDRKMPTYLLEMTLSLSSKMCLKVLSLLDQLEWGAEITLQLIVRKFIEHPQPAVRSRTAYLVSGNLRNIWFLRHALNDPVPEVRLSALKSIGKFSDKFPDKIPIKLAELLYSVLGDFDARVRAKAAQILYIYKDVKGLEMLTSMLNSTDALERAYAANLLGKLKEVSVKDKLKALVKDDKNQTVRLEALKAVKTLDEQANLLRKQFRKLEGILTHALFSEDDQTDLSLADCLQKLDQDTLNDMIKSTGLNPIAAQQFMDVANEIGMPGLILPMLLGTIVDEDGKVNGQKTGDLEKLTATINQTIEQLQSDIPDVVSQSFDELTGVQRDTIKMMLVPALNGEKPRVTATAARVLHSLKYTHGSNKLTEMACDPDPQMRLHAAEALSAIADEFSAQHLKQLANDEDAEVQGAAQKGLDAIQPKLERNNVEEVNLNVTDYDMTDFPTVKLYIRLADKNNHSLKDVELNDFIVLEGSDNPVKARIRSHVSQKEIAAVMVMDYSASMTESAISDVERATERFIDNLAPTDSAVILKFAEEVDVIEKLTSDKQDLGRAIRSEYRLSTQGTALYDSIIQATDQLNPAEEGIKVVVVNTDGADTASERSSYHATQHATEKQTAVYTIGLGDEVDTKVLQEIAKSTDGLYYAAADSGELLDIYEMIFKDIRFEYEITYESEFPYIDASNRNVEVYANYGKHKIKAMIELPPFKR